MGEINGLNGTNGVQSTNGANGASVPHYDVLIIGGGFGGCYSLHKFREAGFRCHLFEAGSALGGVWHWNSYPGARVDSEMPYYQFSIPQVYKTWNWSQRFPGHAEIKRYFQHVDKVLDLSKDIDYNSIVVGADFDKQKNRWEISTNKGHKVTCQWLVPATGSSHKRYEPDFPGLKDFKGQLIHSASWPSSGVDFSGKRVAIVGSGATGIQCLQEISKEAKHLVNYIRNPNIALPMLQRQLTDIEQISQKGVYGGLFRLARETAFGIAGESVPTAAREHTPEQREALWEELFSRGGFNFQASNYCDYLVDEEVNRMLYDFWAKKVRERVKDPAKQDIVAPLEPPYPFATKRSSLEHDYYECINRDNVELVNLQKSPIDEFTAAGIKSGGQEREFDIVVLATGYDNMTGSLTSMGLRGEDGVDMKKRWVDGVRTHLGITSSGNPNMFMIFGPQAPTAFTNAPVFLELQVDVVVEFLKKLRDETVYYIQPKPFAEEQWGQTCQDISNATLFTKANSWYVGANIPGKKREQLNYIGGMPAYLEACKTGLNDWANFDVRRKDDNKDQLPKEAMPIVR